MHEFFPIFKCQSGEQSLVFFLVVSAVKVVFKLPIILVKKQKKILILECQKKKINKYIDFLNIPLGQIEIIQNQDEMYHWKINNFNLRGVSVVDVSSAVDELATAVIRIKNFNKCINIITLPRY